MNGNRFRVPLLVCYSNDKHFFRRRSVPTFQYVEDVLHCWESQRGINRFLAERLILKEVKVAGILEGVKRLTDLRCWLLEHERLARTAKMRARKCRIQKAGKVEYPSRRLDPTVKVLAIVGGALVTLKGNHFRRRYAYRETADNSTSVRHLVASAKYVFSHYSEQYAFPDEFASFSNNDSSDSVRDALEVFKREGGTRWIHVMPNV